MTRVYNLFFFPRLFCANLMCLNMDRVKRIWYLSPMRAAKVQASLHIRAVSPEPPLLAHTSGESRGTFRQKARSLASLNGWACAVKTCHDGMLEDTNSLDGAHMNIVKPCSNNKNYNSSRINAHLMFPVFPENWKYIPKFFRGKNFSKM